MRMNPIRHPLRLYPLLIALLFVSGCQDYEIEVVLESTGGGHRSVSLAVDSDLEDESTPDLDAFRDYFGLDAAMGWRRVSVTKEDGEAGVSHPRTRFAREARVADAASWKTSDGDLHVRATLAGGTYGTVEFTNSISVVSGKEDGAPWLRYEESFRWQDLLRSVVNLQNERFDTIIGMTYPSLAAVPKAELRGLLSGAFLSDLRLQVDDAEDEEREAMRNIYGQLMLDVLSRHGMQSTMQSVEEVMGRVIDDPDGEAEGLLAQAMPGLDSAFLTSIELKVSFPGVIIDSNADEVEGNTAHWRFGISDAAFQPVVLFARAMIQD